MRFNKIRIIGDSTVNLPLGGQGFPGPFVLKSADGLGPSEVTLFYGSSILEKRDYQGKKSAPRQAVLLIALHPDWYVGQTPEALREILYGLLAPRYDNMVRLQIMMNDTVLAECSGQLSNLEPSIFTKDPEVQLTLDCDYPYLLAPELVQTQPAQRVYGEFRAFDVTNPGSAPSGFRLGMILRANAGEFLTLQETVGGRKIRLAGSAWTAGTRLVIDTRPGSRGVWRGVGTNPLVSALSDVDPSVTEWLRLHRGENSLTINVPEFDWDNVINFEYQPAYLGV